MIGADIMHEAFLIDGGADEVICTRRFGDDTKESFPDLYTKIYAEEASHDFPCIPIKLQSN